MKTISNTQRWRIKYPEKALAKYKKDWAIKKTTLGYRYFNIRSHAKMRGWEYLTRDEFEEWFPLQEKVCHYCGVTEESSIRISTRVLQIDRKDNDIGYLIHNMVLACCMCNGVKSNILSYDEMKFVGEKVISKKWQKK